MPKKSFKNNPALAFIGNTRNTEPEESGTYEPQGTQRTQEGSGTNPAQINSGNFPAQPPASLSQKYYRLNLKLKAEYKEYLERVSWEAHKSITQYLNDLIEADKATRNI